MSQGKRQEDAEKLLEAVNEAARRAQGAWFFFLGVSAFLFITVSSITHATLLLDAPVRLPLFQVQMHAYAFFFVAPILYMLMHLGILVQHRILRDKLQALEDALKDKDGKHPLRQRLSIYAYAQHLGGPARRGGFALAVSLIAFLSLSVMPLVLLAYFQASFLPWHSETVTWANRLTLSFDALAVLLVGLFQFRFPRTLAEIFYPSMFRISIREVVTAVPKVMNSFLKNPWKSFKATLEWFQAFTPHRLVALMERGLVLIAILFSFMVMTVTGGTLDRAWCAVGWLDRLWCIDVPIPFVKKEAGASTSSQQRQAKLFIGPAYGWDDKGFDFGDEGGWGTDGTEGGCCGSGGGPKRRAFFLTGLLFERGVDGVSGQPNGWLGLGRNLVVTNLDLNALSGSTRPSLRGRDLSWGVFSYIVLHNADFTGANLTHAKFDGADLTGARFGCADTGQKRRRQRQNPNGETWEDDEPQIQCTNLLHASFDKAKLDGATFDGGDAGRQALVREKNKANVEAGPQPRVSMSGISLVEARFKNVMLQDWIFDEANLTAAAFENVDLSSAYFIKSDLRGTIFKKVNASFANFNSADLRGARFKNSELFAADFSPAISNNHGASLQGVVFSDTRMPFADFSQVALWRTALPEWENEALYNAFEFAVFESAKIIEPTPEERAALREWIKELGDARLQRRAHAVLKPLLEDVPWIGRDRKVWEALITPLDGGATIPVAQRLQARLKFIRLRTEALAKNHCDEQAYWLVLNKVSGIEVEPSDPQEPQQPSENVESLRDERLCQRLKQATAAESNVQKAAQPKQEETAELPPLDLFDPEVFNAHCGNKSEDIRFSEELLRNWQVWINHLKKAAR